MVKIYIADKYLNSEHADFIPALAQHAFLAELRTAVKTVTNDVIEYSGIADGKLSLAFAKQLHTLGVSIEEYPLWIEIASEDEEVPVSISSRTYTNEDEEEVIHTWNTWKKANHTFMLIGDRLFIGSNAHTNENLSLAELSSVLADLHDITSIRTLQAEQEVTI